MRADIRSNLESILDVILSETLNAYLNERPHGRPNEEGWYNLINSYNDVEFGVDVQELARFIDNRQG